MEAYLNRPTDHPLTAEGDPSMCPHLQAQAKSGAKGAGASKKVPPKDNSASETESEDEEMIPQGGCPVMNNGQAKDPRLEIMQQGYNVPYISPLKSLLGFKGFFDLKGDIDISREKWNSYPTYLKHTVFYTNDDFDRARKLEIGHRVFLLDKFKAKGNKYYDKKKYEKAIGMYEKAISFLQWLECDLAQTYDPFDEFGEARASGLLEKDRLEESDIEELRTKFKLDSDIESVISAKNEEEKPKKEKTEEERKEDANKRFDKLILTTFHDKNVKLFDGEELTRDTEKDMRNSMLLTLLLNLASCYMNMNHFDEAKKMIEICKKIAPDNSIVLFRSALCACSNLESSLDELDAAKSEVVLAMKNKKTEKLFQHEEGILRMLGFDNHAEAFDSLLLFATNRIKEMKLRRIDLIEGVVKRVEQINRIEAQIIAEGKVPEEGPLPFRILGCDDDNMEHYIINEILRKYLYVMDFFIESQDQKQYAKAKEEFLMHKEIVDEFNFYWDFKPENYPEELLALSAKYSIDFAEDKYKNRLLRSMKERASGILEAGRFNLDLFQYIVKEYFEKKDKEGKETENEDEIDGATDSKEFSMIYKGGIAVAGFILLGFITMIIYNYFGALA